MKPDCVLPLREMASVGPLAHGHIWEADQSDMYSQEESGVFLSSGAACPDTQDCFQQRNGEEEEEEEEEARCVSVVSIVDSLLVELYDAYSRRSVDSLDSSTEASNSDGILGRSNAGSNFLQELQGKHTRRLQVSYLAHKGTAELNCIIQEAKYRVCVQSAKLVRQLKRKDQLHNKLQKNCDIVTAFLQAVSPKRRVDARLKFTLEPSLGKNGFQQWYDALKAVARLPTGIPKEWRKRVWLTLADHYLHSISIDWDKTLRFAFNDRSNPDDDSLGIQIVKDLHRTGCSSYCGQEGEQDRVVLKRVLLAYARWNKSVGYCQGFNVLAALILEVTEGIEGDALKVMIYLIDKVLPDSYFANNLRALSVDMAVFRDLLRLKLPDLSQHLHYLQRSANRGEGGAGSYEPPLTNVFTMQWFLTMFATCLPHHTVLKIWDSVFFEGSEILLRVALSIWAKLSERIKYCQSADEFYSTMGCLTQEMLEHNLIDSNELMQTVYSMAPFPFPQLAELREKYTYNITPFPVPVRATGSQARDSDEEVDMDDEDSLANVLGCLGPFGGLLAPEFQKYQKQWKEQRGEHSLSCSNIAELSPGAVGAGRAEHQAAINSMMLERMSTDISALKRQYSRIKRRQQQQAGMVYIRAGLEVATDAGILPDPTEQQSLDKCPSTSLLASQLHTSPVVNHLLLGKKLKAERSSNNGSVPLPQAHSTPVRDESSRARLNSPWRVHVRNHRRNLARARAQLGYTDTEELVQEVGQWEQTQQELEEEITQVEKDDDEQVEEAEKDDDEQVKEAKEHVEVTRDEAVNEEEHEVVLEDEAAPLAPAQDVIQVEQQLASLELEPDSEEAGLNPTPDPDPQLPVLPPPPLCLRKQSDSSSSDGSSSIRHSPSAPALAPKARQSFSPFPSVKPLRKSATARNLGLYGPTDRMPNMHFPHMSTSATRRR